MAHSIFLLTKLLFYSKAICYSLIILSPFRYKSGGGHKYISFLYLFSVDSHSSICNLYSFLIPISFYFQTWLSGLGAGGNTRGQQFESSHRPYHLFYFKTWLRCRRQHKRLALWVQSSTISNYNNRFRPISSKISVDLTILSTRNIGIFRATQLLLCNSLCQVKFCLFVKSFKHVLRVFFYLCVCTYILPLPLCVLSLSV